MSTAKPQNIFCIGRNYAAHAKELGNEVPKSPLVFLKPTHAFVQNPKTFALTDFNNITARIDHEVELVLRISKAKAQPTVSHYAIGLDLTARDLQESAKKSGQPWLLAKGLKHFAPCSSWVEARSELNPESFEIELLKNGSRQQHGYLKDFLFPIPKLLTYIDQHFGLGEGDLIFTGTPSGVGPLAFGDQFEARLKNKTETLVSLELKMT